MKPDSITKPSAAETKPNGWPSGSEKRVGRCVSVINTSITPRSASISHRRLDERADAERPRVADRCNGSGADGASGGPEGDHESRNGRFGFRPPKRTETVAIAA